MLLLVLGLVVLSKNVLLKSCCEHLAYGLFRNYLYKKRGEGSPTLGQAIGQLWGLCAPISIIVQL